MDNKLLFSPSIIDFLKREDNFMNPLVSIGIPTYNRPAGLKKLLSSLANQTYSNLEIVISDNCSTDSDVQDIIELARQGDDRITAVRQTENIGMEGNFNAVFNMANGKYFMWMSDDDYFDDNYIEKCFNFLNANVDYCLCSGVAKYYSGEEFLFTERMFSLEDELPAERVIDYFKQVDKNGIFYGLIRKEHMPINPVREYLGFDWNLIAGLSALGKMKCLNSVFYHRSVDGASGGRLALRRKYNITGWKRPFFEFILAKELSTKLFVGFNGVSNELTSIANLRVRVFFIVFKKMGFKLISKFSNYYSKL